jgi:hypothetical protein
MADQCIVCLDTLETVSSGTPQLPTEVDAPPEPAVAAIEASKANNTSSSNENDGHNHGNDDHVALIQICGHVLHDSCLREWTAKANSCPICRQLFHKVHVYDKVGGKLCSGVVLCFAVRKQILTDGVTGTLLSTYDVEDKKQVAEFDPQAWLDENPEEEEESTPCPICLRADDEEVLLLCDGCDTPYHTHCLGLDGVPRGSWFCMECEDALGHEVTRAPVPAVRINHGANGRRANANYFPRTQASMRRDRQRARSDNWQGAWGQISGRIWDALSIDLDYHDDDDALEEYRRSQQVRERERREHQRWQQRLNIASRLGARDVFENSIQNVFAQRRSPTPRAQPAEQVQQTPEEKKAWAALEKSRETDDGGPSSSRKRKAASVTGSPAEPAHEPERKLKRPRTRRVPIPQVQNGEASSSRSTAITAENRQGDARNSSSSARSPPPPPLNQAAPSFLSSLLKEVEMSTPSDDENIRNIFGPIPGAHDAPSPAASSPAASGLSSPRALSTTPPPQPRRRPTSPQLTLSSHIEPIYPPANFSPTRSSPDNSDSETSIRQPRPRRPQPARLPRSQDASPSRAPLPMETKQNITNIVRDVLRPHWKSEKLTAAQYATINREVSHKLYEEITDPTAIDEDDKKNWEKLATREVERAVSELKP